MLATAPSATIGRATPRIAPPLPLRHDGAALRQVAADIGIEPMPWQDVVATYIEALGAYDHWLWPEVCVAASRQNGKTEIIVPHVVKRLRAGRRIMHTAQDRQGIVRDVFHRVSDVMEDNYPDEVRKIRNANGQEEIVMVNGGRYRIVAPTRSGARGAPNDDVIIDEVREFTDTAFIAAAGPTLAQSTNPQTLYFSNAGDDTSVVLNALRDRADADPFLAYLEWSADPDRAADDREGWLESNPAVGGLPGHDMMAYLERQYESHRLAGTLNIWETEHLCRWVPTMRPRLVDDFAWTRCRALKVGIPRRPSFGISMDPSGSRASVVMAWRQEDKTIAMRELFDVAVDAEGLDALGEDAVKVARKYGAGQVGYDDWTDRAFARHFKAKAKAIIGKDFANASDAFVKAIESGQVKWTDCDHVTEDLRSTSRKDNDETGTFHAVRSADDVPITAALAAIRAYWLASGIPPSGSLQVM